jgi:hypothetical protein
MTIYIKQLLAQLQEKYGTLPNDQFARKLVELGVIDFRLCKVLAVRGYVEDAMKKGARKNDAMWMAAERFCCTYENIRRCMYYYTDINFN